MNGMMQQLQQMNAFQKKTCEHSGCHSSATSNFGGERAGRFCYKHIISSTVELNDPKPPAQSTEKSSDEPKLQTRMGKKRGPEVKPANKTKALRKTLKKKHVDQATNPPKVLENKGKIDEGVAPSSCLTETNVHTALPTKSKKARPSLSILWQCGEGSQRCGC